MSRWLETHCGWCHTTIAYLPEWSHIPEYCRDCNEWLEKDCLNPRCPGKIKYKVYWSNIRDYCDCRGWYEIKCAHCYQYFNINDQWDNKPEYCQSCREWKEKACGNIHCSGKVRYKEFWDNKPEYCTCKGWYEVSCSNSHCNGTVSVHSSWRNPPKYCNCKGWYSTRCANSKCSQEVSNHIEWSHPKTHCDTCFQMSKRRDGELCIGNELEEFIAGSRGIKVGRSSYGLDHRHVVIYVDGGHVSGDVHMYSTECLNFHYTLEEYDDEGKRRGKLTW